MKVVITGATSMLGVATINSMLDNETDIKIYAVVRSDSRHLKRLPNDKRVHLVYCDASNYDSLPSLIHEKCDVFYHFTWSVAGKDRNRNILDQSENIPITLKAVTTAHELGCRKFIGSGSQAEYGILDLDKIKPDTPVNPLQPYGIAKYAAGKLSLKLAEQYNMDCLWVRVFSIYGPNDKKTTLISEAIEGLLEGKRVSFTPAEQRWDYLYSSDAGDAFYLIGKKSLGRKIYCLGSGRAKTLKEYISDMQSLINPACPVGIGDKAYPNECVMNICADISDLENDTGWKPKVSFKAGISMIVDTLRKSRGG